MCPNESDEALYNVEMEVRRKQQLPLRQALLSPDTQKHAAMLAHYDTVVAKLDEAWLKYGDDSDDGFWRSVGQVLLDAREIQK